MIKFVVSVLVPDRVGILKRITAALNGLGGNITGISQTVVQGYFTVIVIVEFKAGVERGKIYEALTNRFENKDASVVVRDFEDARLPKPDGSRYILTMFGKEQPGILKRVTAFLAEKNVNIEDLFFKIQGDRVTHIGELTVPDALDVRQLQEDLQALLAPMELRGMLQHENIFRATNEVDAVIALLREENNA